MVTVTHTHEGKEIPVQLCGHERNQPLPAKHKTDATDEVVGASRPADVDPASPDYRTPTGPTRTCQPVGPGRHERLRRGGAHPCRVDERAAGVRVTWPRGEIGTERRKPPRQGTRRRRTRVRPARSRLSSSPLTWRAGGTLPAPVLADGREHRVQAPHADDRTRRHCPVPAGYREAEIFFGNFSALLPRRGLSEACVQSSFRVQLTFCYFPS
jgi:hypothetical protein